MIYTSTIVGYPYIGEDREWKKALEAFGKMSFQMVNFAELKGYSFSPN